MFALRKSAAVRSSHIEHPKLTISLLQDQGFPKRCPRRLPCYLCICLQPQELTLPPRCSRRPWTKSDDDAVRELVNIHGTRNWAVVEQHMVSDYGIMGRSGKQSRERWHNHLSECIVQLQNYGFSSIGVELLVAHVCVGHAGDARTFSTTESFADPTSTGERTPFASKPNHIATKWLSYGRGTQLIAFGFRYGLGFG